MFSGPNRLARARPVGRLLALYALTILFPSGLLAFFGAQALLQERESAEALRARLERVADRVAAALGQALDEWRAAGTALASAGSLERSRFPESLRGAIETPGGIALVSIGSDRIAVSPHGQLLYAPRTPPSRLLPPARAPSWAIAEALELKDHNYEAAAARYEELLDLAARAERPALVQRLARTLRKAGRREAAIARYEELRTFTGPVGIVPADLLASFELCSFWADPTVADRLAPCARTLYADLVAGRWHLDRPTYLHYAAATRGWLRDSATLDPTVTPLVRAEARRVALTEAVADLVARWRSGSAATEPATTFAATPEHLIVSWPIATSDEARRSAVVVSRAWLNDRFWPDLAGAAVEAGFLVEISSFEIGPLFSRATQPSTPAVETTLVERVVLSAGTPLRLRVWPRDPDALVADRARRQVMYGAGIGLVVLVMGFGAYVTIRTIRQELAVAQLKSDFVSAVSHEFRSPLTGIRQLGELLVRGRVTSEDRKQEYYQRIAYESDRLSRLVENLLDFARIQTGRRAYRADRIDTAAWLRELVEDVARRLPPQAPGIDVAIDAELPAIEGDAEALTTAIRNLLDNAVKYGPGRPTVWLTAETDARGVTIRVHDEGPGIDPADQSRMFEPFSRGSGERNHRVPGVGIGLSLVRQIVTAHGGRVTCDSVRGQGATFTVVLPPAQDSPVRS